MAQRESQSLTWVLATLLLAGFLLRFTVAVHWPSLDYPDEVFESLEPAHHLAFGYGVMSWEWFAGVRSWVFPAVLAGLMRATFWLGPGSRGYLHAIVAVLSLVSLTTVWFAFAWGRRARGAAAGILGAAACAIWPPLVYFAPKAFNEVLAGNLLLPGLYLGIYSQGPREKLRLFLAGVFCGLATSLRVQLAPATGFAALYFCRSEWKRKAPVVLAGFLLPVLAFGVVDAFTWSYPFQSFLRYVWINLFAGKASTFGTGPWYWYLLMLAKYLGPMFLLAFFGVRRSPFLGWVALIVVASHSVIPHKEVRFLYPVLPLMLTLGALGLAELLSFLTAHTRLQLSPRTALALGLALIALASAVLARRFPRWNRNSGGLIVMDRLTDDASLCGVGLYHMSWVLTGGYVHLHQNVPMLEPHNLEQLQAESSAFNALVVRGEPQPEVRGFARAGCWNEACLFRRKGPCLKIAWPDEVTYMAAHERE